MTEGEKIMRTREVTDEEILKRLPVVKDLDWLGFGLSDLIIRLDFETAKSSGILKDDASPEGWEVRGRDRETVVSDIKEYMPFAWEKANNRRGISANRSLEHMRSWLFLLGLVNDEIDEFLTDYTHYGKPQLRAICEAFGWDWREWDDGFWATDEMDPGLPPPESIASEVRYGQFGVWKDD